MNKFYEFNNCEYYALVVAKNMDDAIEEYKINVAELNEGYKPNEITVDEVKERMSKVYTLDGGRVDMDYINRMIKLYQEDEESDLVLVDGSLL